ncbi:hypothetical protein ACFWU3_35610 [Streptomyces sp. NPDC058685]|uniref:hypothetical protein n=1 Tax=Streptomyces sp. NPDC058685 TaxID=3346598 RepID=UPI00365ABE41
MEERRVDPANRLESWADGVVADLDAQEDVDRALLHALGARPSLREETAARMADAVRAAALGLGPPGCAVAAGVSERLLAAWQEHDPTFAAAMAAATTMARARGSVPGATPLTPTALRVLLTAMRGGALHGPAAALVGMSGRAFYRLRRERPEVGALVAAARRARPKKADRRKGPKYEQRYRLVRIGDPDGAGRTAQVPPGSAHSGPA